MAASYPGAVKTSATRSAGQTIDASHINDLQDEVNAIESGLLNGTAPLTSSNAVVNALSVSSNSTFAVRPVMPPPDCVVARLESTQALVSSVAVAFARNDFITNSSLHSTGTNPDRFIPQSTGLWELTVGIAFNANSSGHRRITIQDSSNEVLGDVAIGANAVAGAGTNIQLAAFKRFDALGGYMRVSAENNGASTMSLSTGGSFACFRKL